MSSSHTYLNNKIVELTTRIREDYPELSNLINEIPITVPTEKNPDVTLKNLQSYYDSLNEILYKYMKEHPAEKNIPETDINTNRDNII